MTSLRVLSSASQPASQPNSKPASQPASHPVNQPVSRPTCVRLIFSQESQEEPVLFDLIFQVLAFYPKGFF